MAELPISAILAHWAAIRPNEPAVTHEGQTVSWAELEARTNRLARVYESLGVVQDDLVTIALPNGIEFFEAAFATWKAGATPQPVSARLPKFERDQIIEVGQPRLVIGVDPAVHPDTHCIPEGFEADPAISDDALDIRVAASFKAMTSGGSTGRPKLIVAGSPAVYDIEAEALQMQTNGCVLIPGPLYHNGPFLWAMVALFKGNHVVVTTRFDAESTLKLIAQFRVDTIYTVPTMMQRIWNLGEDVRHRYDLSSLRTLWHLAAPCPAWLKEAFIEWLGPSVIWELYGGTEGQGSTVITGDEWLAHRGSVGKPVPTCEMIIVGEDGQVLPANEIGEVFMRPHTGQGSTYRYIGAEARAIEGGWESLGDMGYMDDDGYLYLADRQTDMILSGGANIYPAEVEAAIDAFPGVRSSAVIGLPDEDLGNLVYAIVDIADHQVDETELLAHLAERLVRYKQPRQVEFVREPLRDDAGKVRRKTLREERLNR
ncbi:MAG: AMP-binding protein [Pseudomonadales bacterium]|nr:AMP-binding protein [Pseudomonadales bacterium]